MKFLHSKVASFFEDSMTVPVVVQAAMFNKITSSTYIFQTFLCFSSLSFTPNKFVKRWNLILNLLITSGILPGVPRMLPVSLSALVHVGSIYKPTAIKPPGTAYKSSFFSAINDVIRDKTGEWYNLFWAFF